MELSQSVIMPREDFQELQIAAWDNDQTLGDRVATIVQTTIVITIVATAFAGGTWAYAKAMTWKDQKTHEREMAKLYATNPD